MKLFILLFSLTFSISIFASSYQIYCGNSEATISTAEGHYENYLYFSLAKVVGNEVRKVKVEFDPIDLVRTVLSTTTIEVESYSSCEESDSEWGWGWSKNHYVQKITFKKADNSLFDERTIGASVDRRSITTTLVCKETTSSEFPCP